MNESKDYVFMDNGSDTEEQPGTHHLLNADMWNKFKLYETPPQSPSEDSFSDDFMALSRWFIPHEVPHKIEIGDIKTNLFSDGPSERVELHGTQADVVNKDCMWSGVGHHPKSLKEVRSAEVSLEELHKTRELMKDGRKFSLKGFIPNSFNTPAQPIQKLQYPDGQELPNPELLKAFIRNLKAGNNAVPLNKYIKDSAPSRIIRKSNIQPQRFPTIVNRSLAVNNRNNNNNQNGKKTITLQVPSRIVQPIRKDLSMGLSSARITSIKRPEGRKGPAGAGPNFIKMDIIKKKPQQPVQAARVLSGARVVSAPVRKVTGRYQTQTQQGSNVRIPINISVKTPASSRIASAARANVQKVCPLPMLAAAAAGTSGVTKKRKAKMIHTGTPAAAAAKKSRVPPKVRRLSDSSSSSSSSSDSDSSSDDESEMSTTPKMPPKTPAVPAASDEDDMRSAHNVLERNRRQCLTSCFARLRDAVPELKEKASKAQILNAGKECIKQLEKEQVMFLWEKEMARIKVEENKMRLESLEASASISLSPARMW